ncbi:MAG: NAD-dependent epimerase/dehydratase family protein [Pseudomonadota bacterium]
MRTVLVTGTAGFIGFHVARLLLAEGGFRVIGYDNLNSYYDVKLKEGRRAILKEHDNYTDVIGNLEDLETLKAAVADTPPDVIIHLAAQAGVRHSLDAPGEYIQSNVVGTFNVMEIAREHKVVHLMIASTSSAYGANTEYPFRETQKSDLPLTIYAATKKATEGMGHCYASLWGIPTTMFRFFTVYGPWGRPDMAYFKFTDRILNGKPIDIYNHGEMERDFTYVDDLVRAIRLLMDAPPLPPEERGEDFPGDSVSPVAPHRLVNIGNSQSEKLLDFIEEIERALGQKAKRNYMDMQPGDVKKTWADATLLQALTGYKPETSIREGVDAFVAWYVDFYGIDAAQKRGMPAS